MSVQLRMSMHGDCVTSNISELSKLMYVLNPIMNFHDRNKT